MREGKNKTSSDCAIDYGPEFLEKVRDMHAGAEELPDYEKWIIDHMGGRVETFRKKLLRQIRAFTRLENADILDFGCGTGSTTVMLASARLRHIAETKCGYRMYPDMTLLKEVDKELKASKLKRPDRTAVATGNGRVKNTGQYQTILLDINDCSS